MLEARQVLAGIVVISEVMYNPSGSDAGREFVEIYNAGDADIDLNGYVLQNLATTGNPPPFQTLYQFTSPRILAPGAYLAIVDNVNSSAYAAVPPANKVGNNTAWTGGRSLGNMEDSIRLCSSACSAATVVAQLDYEESFPWSEFADGWGASLQIIDPLKTFNPVTLTGGRYRSDNWTSSIEVNGSPGRAPVAARPGVVINELLASSNNAIGELDKIEFYNSNDTDIDIGGWFVTDTDNTAAGTSTLSRYVFPSPTIIPGKGHLVIDESLFGVGTNQFRLDGTGGEGLALMKPGTGGAATIFADQVIYPPSEQSVSFARNPSGQGPFFPAMQQTFGVNNAGAKNTGHKVSNIVISEIMYHPPGAVENVDLEYIELLNRGTTAVNLAATSLQNGWQLRRDFDFDFPTNNAAMTTLQPNERLLVLRFDPAAPANAAKRSLFQSTYQVVIGTDTAAGQVKAVGIPTTVTNPDTLSNGDAVIELRERVLVGLSSTTPPTNVYDFVPRDTVHYFDGGGWPGRADGDGSSLERIDGTLYGDDSESWRSSFEYNGTPGKAPNPTKTVVINEVLAHTDQPLVDAFELYNTSAVPVNIGGWVVTDDLNPNYALRFTIPSGTILQPNQYMMFNQGGNANQFRFGLDAARGDSLWLLQMNGNQIVRFADNVSFGATFNGASVGRWPNGTGDLIMLSERTLPDPLEAPGPGVGYSDGANSGPWFDDLVISEIMYNRGGPNSDRLEYIELYNRRPVAINLGPIIQDVDDYCGNPPVPCQNRWTQGPPQGWRIDGDVRFDFTLAHSIPANGTLLVVGFDPVAEPDKLALFKNTYGLQGSTVPIVGPFRNGTHLNDYGDVLHLDKPDGAPTTLALADRFTPNVEVDRVPYDNDPPWPTIADGGGKSLTRTASDVFGGDYLNWPAADPTPGTVTFSQGGTPPKVTAVTLWGSTWSTSFLNEVTPGGAPIGGFRIPPGSSQTTPLPWTNIDRISITFDENVTIASNALQVRGVHVASYTVSAAATYNAATRTATWTIQQPMDSDRLILDLRADRVLDDDNLSLDGEWTDSASNYPSGNGTAGGNLLMRFNVQGGDINRNGRVSMIDVVGVRNYVGRVAGESSYDELYDLNGSGIIDVADLTAARLRQFRQLPATLPGSPAAPDAVVATATDTAVSDASQKRDGGESTMTSALAAATSRRARPLSASAVDRLHSDAPTDDTSSSGPRLQSTRRAAAVRYREPHSQAII